MTYSETALKQIKAELAKVDAKAFELLELYFSTQYSNAEAREFATYGFARRVKLLSHCIKNVFDLFPPEQQDIPDADKRHNAEINLQAFIINVFGALDNLAWIWVKEKNIKKPDGKELDRRQVGLRRHHKLVRESLPAEFVQKLDEFEKWAVELEDYRDALAHRIPLYIPPKNFLNETVAIYQELEDKKAKALEAGEYGKFMGVIQEQEKLAVFRPWVKHSFIEKSKRAWFHEMLLVGFLTVEELGMRLHKDLGCKVAKII